MIAYYVLLLCSVLFNYIALSREKRTVWKSAVGRSTYVQANSLALPVFFFLLFLLLALRGNAVGNDTSAYKTYFLIARAVSLEHLPSFLPEALFVWLNWCIGRFTDNQQAFIAVTSAICVLPIGYIYLQDRRHSVLKILLFINMTTFAMLFSGIRQSLAMATGMIAYGFVQKRRILPYIISVVIAIGFHHSGFILFLLYPLCYLNLKRKHLWVIIPALLIVLAFNDRIFFVLTTLYNRFIGDLGEVELEATGAITSFVLFVLFAVFAYAIPDETKMDREALGLRNILTLAVFFQCFASVHVLAMRMNYYFILFIPLTIPKILEVPKSEFKQIAKLGEVVLTVFFAAYFIMTVVKGYTTGDSALNTIPYVPFWEG